MQDEKQTNNNNNENKLKYNNENKLKYKHCRDSESYHSHLITYTNTKHI